MAELNQYMALSDAMLYSVAGQHKDAGQPIAQKLAAANADPINPSVQSPRVIKASDHGQVPQRKPAARAVQSGRFRWAILALAAFLVFLLGISNLYWLFRVGQLQEKESHLLALLTLPTDTPGVLPTEIPTAQPTILLTTVPNTVGQVRYLELESIPSSNAHAVVVWESGPQVGTLYVTGLPALNEDKVYQLWVVRNAHDVSLGAFTVDHHGIGTMAFKAPEPIETFQAMGISAEPAPSSPQPTGNMDVIANISG
jgi:hypothetical protein